VVSPIIAETRSSGLERERTGSKAAIARSDAFI
jgi:hypothetical protein